jgi:NTE family protein
MPHDTRTPAKAKAAAGHSSRVKKRPSFDCIALLLQGGGALGAYQAGVYQALAEADLHPDWTAGVSIGAINAAIIAGNAPDARVDKLREFWRLVTTPPAALAIGRLDGFASVLPMGTVTSQIANQLSAAQALFAGVSGFFVHRIPSPWLWPAGTVGASSYYDTTMLKGTLERVIDLDRINAGGMRLSVGAERGQRQQRLLRYDDAHHPR